MKKSVKNVNAWSSNSSTTDHPELTVWVVYSFGKNKVTLLSLHIVFFCPIWWNWFCFSLMFTWSHFIGIVLPAVCTWVYTLELLTSLYWALIGKKNHGIIHYRLYRGRGGVGGWAEGLFHNNQNNHCNISLGLRHVSALAVAKQKKIYISCVFSWGLILLLLLSLLLNLFFSLLHTGTEQGTLRKSFAIGMPLAAFLAAIKGSRA